MLGSLPSPDSTEVPREPEIPKPPAWEAAPQDFGYLKNGLYEFSKSHSKDQNVSLLLFFHLFHSLNQCC